MIRIFSAASGSTGNCMYAEMGGYEILIDLGITRKAAVAALARIDRTLDDIDAVFITHTHSDHIKGLPVIRKSLTAPIFAGSTTCSKLNLPAENSLSYHRRTEVLPGLFVTAFPTSHDCPGSVGFVFESDAGKLGYATDLGIVTDDIRALLNGSDVMVIESNHDREMLRNGPYTASLKHRILSDSGHLANDDCAKECAGFLEHGTRHFLLAHLSKENNTPDLARSCTEASLAGTGASVHILPPQCDELLCFEIE